MASEMKSRIEAVINEWRHIGEPILIARKVLEAMREPTEDMMAVAEGYADFILPDCFGNTQERRVQELTWAWTKAVDVALYPPLGRPEDLQKSESD